MTKSVSPLRYPGGKSTLTDTVASLIRENDLVRGHYAEPYAGGGSLALNLLFTRQVTDIHLNDIDHGIWSFWHCVLRETDRFCEAIMSTSVTIDEWLRQKSLYRAGFADDPFEFGFATFFLNRTNRSGIIGSGGAIGGYSQSGAYKVDCRFNRDELVRRVKRIAKHKASIHLTRLDAVDFLQYVEVSLPRKTFLAIDPPYYEKGSSLYTNFYHKSDHAVVAEAIQAQSRKWILTYDNSSAISHTYKGFRQFEFDISYSANRKTLGSELFIVSDELAITTLEKSERFVAIPHRAAA